MSQQLPGLWVEIHKLGYEFFVVTQDDNGRELCTTRFQHNPTGLTHLGPLWLLERGSPGSENQQGFGLGLRKASQGQVALYGRRLYEYLFGNGKKLNKFLRDNPHYEQARLTLEIHSDAASLWRLPWEYLHNGQDFVCLNGQMQLVRLPGGATPLSLPKLPLPLRILFVIASPDDQEFIDVERELAVILETLDNAVVTGHIHMEVLTHATLPALQDTLKQEHLHILHYVGHGRYGSNQQGFLCLEDASGHTDSVGPVHLNPLLAIAPDLRFVTLSACQGAQTGVLDAFEHIASGMLQFGLPAVLSVPNNLQDESAIALYHTLYTALYQGETLEASIFKARSALQRVDTDRPVDRQCFDWGVPALYLRGTQLAIIDPDLTVETPTFTPDKQQNVGGLTVPRVFVGRRRALQTLRNALRERISALYIWGVGGIGKSALAAKFTASPGIALDDVLIIRCQEYPLPIAVLGKIAEFWEQKGTEIHHEAAMLLLDARQAPQERARKALYMIAEQQDFIIFDNLDAWFVQTEEDLENIRDSSLSAEIMDSTMREVLLGFLSARANTTLVFTGRQRWQAMEEVPLQERVEIQLGLLPQHQAIVLMNTLPRLGKVSLQDKLDVLCHTGGHPKALALLDGWLAGENNLQDFLNDPTVQNRVAEMWQYYFLQDLLARLDPGERDILDTLVIWNDSFCAHTLSNLSDILPDHAQILLEKWHGISLTEFHRVGSEDEGLWYTLHPVVREHLLRALSPDFQNLLHARAARYYGLPFIEEARRQITVRGIAPWSDERIAWLARSPSGVLGMWLRQTEDLTYAKTSLARALAWRYHLLQADQAEAAAQVVKSVVPVLNRWGHQDHSRALLNSNAVILQGAERAENLRALADLDLEAGHLDEALEVYEEVYQTLKKLNTREQLGYVLFRISNIYQRKACYDEALRGYRAALKWMRELDDKVGQAACLDRLARIHRQLAKYKQALTYSQAAREIYTKLENQAGQAKIWHEQGHILEALERYQSALETFRHSMDIARSIGDEVQVTKNLESIARLLQKGQHFDAALNILDEALRIYQKQNDSAKVVTILEAQGDVYQQQGKAKEASQKYAQAKRYMRTQALEQQAAGQ